MVECMSCHNIYDDEDWDACPNCGNELIFYE